MNEETIIKREYGNMDISELDIYSAVQTGLSESRHRRRYKIKPTALIILILVFTLSATAAAVSVIYQPDRYYPPFYTEEGEYVDAMANYQYASEVTVEKGDDQSFYTKAQILQMLDNNEIVIQQADIRQPHLHPASEHYEQWLQDFDDGVFNGSNVPAGLCDNTFFFLHEGKRACNQCGFIFTEEQNREIGIFN